MPVWFTAYVVIFLFILALPSQPLFFLLLTQCDGCLDDTVWGLWLAYGDCQSWEQITVEGPTGHSGGPLLSQVPIFYTM